MRHRTIALAASFAVIATTLVLPPPAAASHWFFGGGFSIGGLDFHIGLRPGGQWDDYYYRVARAVPSRHRCSTRCFVVDRHSYHHRSCPVIQVYFRDYGYHEGLLFGHYAPRGDGYRNDYDRRSYRDWRYDNDPRYDQHPRYDHHRWHRDRHPGYRSYRHYHYHGRDRCSSRH